MSPASAATGLARIHLLTTLPTDQLAALSAWSDAHHPELLRAPGYLSAARYEALSPLVGAAGEALAQVFTTYVVTDVAAAYIPPDHRAGMTPMPADLAASLSVERRVLASVAVDAEPDVGGEHLVRVALGPSGWPELYAALAPTADLELSAWTDDRGAVLLAAVADEGHSAAVADQAVRLLAAHPVATVDRYHRVFAAAADSATRGGA